MVISSSLDYLMVFVMTFFSSWTLTSFELVALDDNALSRPIPSLRVSRDDGLTPLFLEDSVVDFTLRLLSLRCVQSANSTCTTSCMGIAPYLPVIYIVWNVLRGGVKIVCKEGV